MIEHAFCMDKKYCTCFHCMYSMQQVYCKIAWYMQLRVGTFEKFFLSEIDFWLVDDISNYVKSIEINCVWLCRIFFVS